ncbi:acyl-CoA dehydrogenase family protein [Micromonospora sp. CPCC 206061]|uniref:acyl-CoA dehydrogenase family protein n=1 Tax=Micromonospora sp. CPCC 206061 TaxID=3122410 RepID=UPI002FF1FAAF
MSTTLSRVTELKATIAGRAEQIESERCLPADLLSDLAAAGALRMLVPRERGGANLPLPETLRVVEALATADASVAWTVAQASVAQLVFRHFPAAALDEVYASGPDVVGAGAVAPKGRAEACDGGWRVTGDWPFVTGIPHARWVYLQCLVVDRGRPRLRDGDLPELRLVLLPAAEVTVLDTWHSAGLRGTASHDVRAARVSCPPERTCSFDAEPALDGPLRRLPARDQGGLFVAAVAVGAAAGALDDVATLARGGKRPAFALDKLADAPVFQDRLGEAHMLLRSARAQLYAEVDAAWEAALAGTRPTDLARAQLRATAPVVVGLARRVARHAFELGGGAAVYQRSPLQRRLRDVQTAGQHFSAGRDFYRTAGALLAGADPGIGLR